ncbi:type II toxin-antitoxin system VapC family toxin [Halosimplex litoreum]|uniref:Ribonuclease VapC n=1 Tax=Halosimplex litoreum TaxID=1198301 RepID=A0A7T3G110_9EURY|nr:type II toxin-antitoxin system VapC family toxin [Halosimplex litoreum]QPV64316.1 type II toxin-antitoxin system VapC family toxin [Halosimplex litoreum]
MSVVIDSGVFYAHADIDATRHDVAVRAFDALIDGEEGRPYVSDYLYDEAVTLTLSRTGSFEQAKRVGRRMRGATEYPDLVTLEHVDRSVFRDAVDTFERFDDQGLSFTDATTIALLEKRGIDSVLSFDDDFDGIVDRIDPADLG